MLTALFASRECASSSAADHRDQSAVQRQFGHWSARLFGHFLQRRPLPRHWLPQRDRHSGRVYYFNLQTGAVSQSHPLQAAADALRDREWERAQEELAERQRGRGQARRALRENVARQRADAVGTIVQMRRTG